MNAREKNKDKRKKDIETQWTKIKMKMNQLIRIMEQINIKKIGYHA